MIDRYHVTGDDSLVDHDRVDDLIDACPNLGSITIGDIGFR